jgi:hypothetical protein
MMMMMIQTQDFLDSYCIVIEELAIIVFSFFKFSTKGRTSGSLCGTATHGTKFLGNKKQPEVRTKNTTDQTLRFGTLHPTPPTVDRSAHPGNRSHIFRIL